MPETGPGLAATACPAGRFSVVISHPLLNACLRCGGRDITLNVPVQNDGRRDAASTKAARDQDRHFLILGRFARLASRRLLNGGDQLGRTLDIAGCTPVSYTHLRAHETVLD